jgi:DNA polymerase-1
MFQLASERTTLLMPVRGVSELLRVGPAEVRERYGVEPEQVPDFIALRGDPSDRLPGAPGVGAKTAASLLVRYGSLEEALADGRFPTIADELRLFRHIATVDTAAPLPPIPDAEPDWRQAAALLERWGVMQLSERLAART